MKSSLVLFLAALTTMTAFADNRYYDMSTSIWHLPANTRLVATRDILIDANDEFIDLSKSMFLWVETSHSRRVINKDSAIVLIGENELNSGESYKNSWKLLVQSPVGIKSLHVDDDDYQGRINFYNLSDLLKKAGFRLDLPVPRALPLSNSNLSDLRTDLGGISPESSKYALPSGTMLVAKRNLVIPANDEDFGNYDIGIIMKVVRSREARMISEGTAVILSGVLDRNGAYVVTGAPDLQYFYLSEGYTVRDFVAAVEKLGFVVVVPKPEPMR